MIPNCTGFVMNILMLNMDSIGKNLFENISVYCTIIAGVGVLSLVVKED